MFRAMAYKSNCYAKIVFRTGGKRLKVARDFGAIKKYLNCSN